MKTKLLKTILSVLLLSPVLSQAQVTTHPTSPSSRPISGTMLYIYTDKHTPIKAFKPDNIADNIHSSNGWTFADGQYLINNDQVPLILKDEYNEIPFNRIQDKDILVRYESGKVVYTLTACKPQENNQCDNKPQPAIFLFVLSENAKINHPETMKIYRHIQEGLSGQ